MRGMIVIALCTLAIPIAFLSPFLGLLAYCWLSYMRPQDMAWGVGHISFGLFTAAALFAGLLTKLRFQFFRWHPITWIFLMLWAWWAWCTYHAYDREIAMDGLTQISRIFLICFVTTGLCTTKNRLRWVIVAIAGSLCFHGTKLGIHGILTGGSKQLQPIGGLMSGNNENAIALSIGLPFAVQFALEETRKWRRIALWSVVGLTTIAIILTYSRGGFLGLAGGGGGLVWHTRARFFSLFVAAPALVCALLIFAPQDYRERIGGIGEASKTDFSAQTRLMAWGVAATITAEHPIEGIGPKNFYTQSKRFPRPAAMPDLEIHDTYLELSSSLGLPGLALYLVLVGASWTTASRVRKEVRRRDDPRLEWFARMATGTQAAMAAFLVSSVFGSLAHFDLMYHLCALTVCLPAAFRHESERLDAEDLAAVVPAAAEGPAEAPHAVNGAATAPAALRAEELAAAPSVPAGFPDFRACGPSAPDVAPPPEAPGAGAVVSPVPDAAARDDEPHTADDAQVVVTHRALLRHTAPEGPREDVEPDANTIELEDLFIDPYGTTHVRADDYADSATASQEPPPPPPRRSSRAASRPFLSPLERHALERRRAAPDGERPRHVSPMPR